MITIKPFRAYLPTKENVSRVACLPYDVMDRQEAKTMAGDDPDSFLHVVRSEIDLPDTLDEHDPAVYQKAAQNLSSFISRGVLLREDTPGFYVYSQTFLGKTQTGIVALCSVEDYEQGRIKKHEHTLPQKEEDRIANFLACSAHTEPVFLAHKPNSEISAIVDSVCKAEPYFDFTTPQGVVSRFWIVNDLSTVSALKDAFSRLDALYIADGHHRTQSAYRVSKKLAACGEAGEETDSIMSVIFPQDQLNILPYNRILKSIAPYSVQEFLELLSHDFELAPCSSYAAPAGKHHFMLYLDSKWYSLAAKPSVCSGDPVASLDVSILQEHVFSKLFSISDPRTDSRLTFVGGIRGEAYLKEQVDAHPGSCAFVLHGVDFADIASIADNGGVMPPKSTWFEPKLSSGLFIHKF